MELSLFCDTYIINEYLRLKSMLEAMPRYKTGTHKGHSVIREHKGTGAETVKKIAFENSPAYGEMHQQLLLYDNCKTLKKLFLDEIRRRHLNIPESFSIKNDTSDFNLDFWNSLIPCSNSHEIRTEYYDDYGYHVRSRGEMLIGNSLKDLGLEAKYEPCLFLKIGRKAHPDYSFPVPLIGRCFFIEFVGMTDNDEYINFNYGKTDEYMRNGILPNRDLILLCGSETYLPSQETIKRIVSAFINTAVENIYNKKS